jgi:hypothetical protein
VALLKGLSSCSFTGGASNEQGKKDAWRDDEFV